jgi:hypothetical protein
MKFQIAMIAGAVATLGFASTSMAGGGFEDAMDGCISKFANTRDAAQVMLECNASGGKLSGCKVVSDSAAGKGFDKAAICVAEKLPMAKEGAVKVPFRFPGQG